MELNEEIEHLNSLILQMSGVVEKNLFYAFDVYLNYDNNKYYHAVDDEKVNAYERWIEADALHIMLKEKLYASDLRIVTGIMSMVQDLERLGDHAKDILEFSLKVKNANIEPARIKPTSAIIGFGGVIATAIIARVIALTVVTEPASPSTPSIKFRALLIPTIHNIVIGYDQKPKSIPPKNGTESI